MATRVSPFITLFVQIEENILSRENQLKKTRLFTAYSITYLRAIQRQHVLDEVLHQKSFFSKYVNKHTYCNPFV